jgi:hypothetical protein
MLFEKEMLQTTIFHWHKFSVEAVANVFAHFDF